MPLDSVSNTFTSLSVYESNKPSFSLAPSTDITFLHVLFRSTYFWNQSVFMGKSVLKGKKPDCLTDDTERGKQTKSPLVIEKEDRESNYLLIKDKTNNKLHKKQHANISTLCNSFYFGPNSVEQQNTFHKAFAIYFHAAPKQVLLSQPSVSILEEKGRPPFNTCTYRQTLPALTDTCKSQNKYLLQLTDHFKF